MSNTLEFGVYECELCHKHYTVNDARTFARCTPTKCHDCNRAWQAALRHAAEICRERFERSAEDCAQAIERAGRRSE
jgi:hypothetical protein